MIRYLFHRKAAPRKGRVEQFRVGLADGSVVDVTPEMWRQIDSAAIRCGWLSYGGWVRLADDVPGHGKWSRARIKMPNDLADELGIDLVSLVDDGCLPTAAE